jgi:antitoxin component YwqK of YwqJK toxin-antitoxin module
MIFNPGDYVDGIFVRTKYLNYNKGADDFLSPFDQYIRGRTFRTDTIRYFSEGVEERTELYQYPLPIARLYPENDLLHGDEQRVKRVWRKATISDSINSSLQKLKIPGKDSTIDLIELSIRSMMSGEVIGFDDATFYVPLERPFIRERLSICKNSENPDGTEKICDLKSLNTILVKEDWYYDKIASRFRSKIIGIALAEEIKKEDEISTKALVWLYYPAMKYLLNTYLTSTTISAAQYLDSIGLKSEVIKTETPKNDHQTEPRISYDFETEFDALFEIQQLNEVFSFSKKDKTKNGDWSELFPNGTAALHGKLSKGNKKGLWVFYYPNGAKRTEISFKNNFPEGVYKSYYKNGDLKEEAFFEKGLRTGVWKAYYENGKTKSLKNYKNGYQDGIQQVWYDNGQALMQYTFQNGELNGPLKRWYKDGLLLEEGVLEKGFVKGLWNYQIKLDDHCCKILKENDVGFQMNDPKPFEDCSIRFSQEYIHENKAGCPNNFCVKAINSKLLPR